MDTSSAFEISAAGMALERARVEVAALNLANVHSTAAAGQPGYNPMRVVATSAPAASFDATMESQAGLAALKPGYRLEATNAPAHLVHEPGHPMADAKGFVSYPGVDTATEMMSLMSATRAYEANVAAMSMARALAMKSLEIGGTQ